MAIVLNSALCISLKSTIEYLGEWEKLYNPNFNCTEFDTIKNAAGSNNFVLSVKVWIQRTGAIGIMAKAGRYGGTYAHRDIAYHFGMWISPRFQLLLVKEYQRLKADEQKQLSWSAKRELSKINYRIHTDAIKENLIPNEVTREQAAMKYADEADVLNIAMFGMTARQWREQNPDKKGNIRDYANFFPRIKAFFAYCKIQKRAEVCSFPYYYLYYKGKRPTS